MRHQRLQSIVAQLKKLYPEEGINLLRALVVQGARLPNGHFLNPIKKSIKFLITDYHQLNE